MILKVNMCANLGIALRPAIPDSRDIAFWIHKLFPVPFPSPFQNQNECRAARYIANTGGTITLSGSFSRNHLDFGTAGGVREDTNYTLTGLVLRLIAGFAVPNVLFQRERTMGCLGVQDRGRNGITVETLCSALRCGFERGVFRRCCGCVS